MRRALVSQHLQPRALDQGARDRGYAQGDPRGEDLAAAREKAIRVIEKLRGLRLSRAAELVEAAVEETLTPPRLADMLNATGVPQGDRTELDTSGCC